MGGNVGGWKGGGGGSVVAEERARMRGREEKGVEERSDMEHGERRGREEELADLNVLLETIL